MDVDHARHPGAHMPDQSGMGRDEKAMDEESAELRKFRKELNAGAVSLVLLAVLEEAAEPMYGYQIRRALEEMAAGAPLVKPGTLYPLLRTMGSQGLVMIQVA